MNIEGLEIRVNRKGGVIYYKDDVVVGRRCTDCGKDKEISEFAFQNKKKNTYLPYCKECNCKKTKEWTKNNTEKKKEYDKRYAKENAEHIKGRKKQWYKENIEHIREYNEKYQKNNKEYLRDYKKRYAEENIKHIKEQKKQKYENSKEKNLQYISNMLEQINPTFKKLSLPVYGYVYMFENVKTGRKYVGQSINPIKTRYRNGIIKGWIKERLEYNTQKFTEELIETDIKVTEVIDIAFCQYHLDKLEAYYINKYDSYNNGYNNTIGNHITDDGIEEFNQILSDHNLEFKDGKLIQIKAPTNR